MPGKFTDEQIEAYLDSRPGWAILSTIDKDGFPHSVPLGYFRFGRDIVMGVRDGTRKVANVESNPHVSVLLEDGSSMADIRGVMVQGHARIVREPGEALQLAREGALARGVPEAEWPSAPRPGAAYIRVTPVRTLSWDYSNSASDQA
ncbi:MAG TPA: pyridoxamine 5'-phosphate oxidase family protein [Mycobacterium sp.]|uniref:pyridoxamine 5'-phosphate oxidase family protein n=1 Tax=Mycolicibacterium sp. TaxID=2320850 RepID=UPI0025ED870A|nr:pyridoxamine 5'-phosphate oxidase family protein [Mycolicibacterium sp.]HPX35964.1 pyridoxamine 5'-phosphate oxidase family protein [Mycobacterium sp.]HQC76196.1 pyridoxamine 5'-phosphate oxidase family protein [Mycobacterium sp.]